MAERILDGYTVGITADRRWEEQATLFERRGARVVHGPAIRTLPLAADAPLRRVTETLIADPPDVLIANTGLGIRSWLGQADGWDLGRSLGKALAQARIYARGPKASGALHSAGLEVAARASTERLGEIVDLVIATLSRGQHVAVQMDGSGTTPELQRLRDAGAHVTAVPVYRWTRPDDTGPALRLAEAVVAGRVHAVTFTAGPAIGNWLALAAEVGVDSALREALTDGRTVVGCVGPVCADAAGAEGLLSAHLVQPDAYRLGPLVRAVAERLNSRDLTVDVTGTTLILRGQALSIGNRDYDLTVTEAQLLAALAARPGAVLTKERLLRAVWPTGVGDAHTVEVAVGRLRKRLGPDAGLIRSVPRRGYSLRA